MPCRCIGRTSGATDSLLKGENCAIERGDTIVQLFERAVRKHRKKDKVNAPAVIFDQIPRYTFTELSEMSTRMAHVLSIELGDLLTSNINNDLIIGFCLFPSHDVILVILAILKVGAAFMCFDVTSTPERIVRQVGYTRPISILIDENAGIVKRCESVSKATKLLSINYVLGLSMKLGASRTQIIKNQSQLVLESSEALLDRVAAVVCSAGSTGYPRTVRLNHLSIVNAVSWYNSTFPFEEYTEVSSLCSPCDSVHSIVEIFSALCRFVPLVVLTRSQLSSPHELLERIYSDNISRLTMQPAQLKRIICYIQENREVLFMTRWLKYIFSTQSSIPVKLAKDFFNDLHLKPGVNSQTGAGDSKSIAKKRKSPKVSSPEPGSPWLVNLYGLAETTGDACYEVFHNLEDFENKIERNKVSLGRPVSNTIVYIMDDEQNILTLGQAGEICFAGLGTARGYSGIEGENKFFKNVWNPGDDYRTLVRSGDYGRIILCKDRVQRLFFEKRLDAEVQVNGMKYDMMMIQHFVSQTDLTRDCVVVCYNTGLPDQRIVVAVVLVSDASVVELYQRLKVYFANKVVAEVLTLSELPLQCNGKLDRECLLHQYRDFRHTVPSDKLESLRLKKDDVPTAVTFCELTSSVLSMSISYVLDNFQASFFDLGGDSLNTLAIVTSLQRQGFSITLEEFLACKTLRHILDKVLPQKKNRTPVEATFCISVEESAKDLLSYENLRKNFQHDVLEIVSTAYAQKSYLCYLNKLSAQEISSFLTEMWDSFLASKASLVATARSTGEIIGVILCAEFTLKLKRLSKQHHKIWYMFEFMQKCNKEALEKINSLKEKIVVINLHGTSLKLSAAETIIAMLALIEAVAERAEENGYTMVLITSSYPVIKDVCRDPVIYRWAYSAVASEFVASDSSMPFHRAPRHHEVNVYCRYVS